MCASTGGFEGQLINYLGTDKLFIGSLNTGGDRFFDGMQVTLKLQKHSRENVLLVSRDALIKRFGKDTIFILFESKAKMVNIKVLGFQGKMVAISSPELKVGDEAIIKGNERLFPNQEIK